MGINAILEALSICSEKERILVKKHIENLALREEDRKKLGAQKLRNFKDKFKRKYK